MKLPFTPETELEAKLCSDPEWLEGAAWGTPRSGHPEGRIADHIAQVLANIDREAVDADERRRLRLIALLHDTFKYRVDNSKLRVGENHHGMIARRFAERYIDDPTVLDIIQQHDSGYHCWQYGMRRRKWPEAEEYATQLADQLGQELPLYIHFYRADNATGDKDQAPLVWFENTLRRLGYPVPPSPEQKNRP